MTSGHKLRVICIYHSADEYSAALAVFRAEAAARGATPVLPEALPAGARLLPAAALIDAVRALATGDPATLWPALDLTHLAEPGDPVPGANLPPALSATLNALTAAGFGAALALFDARRLPGHLLLALLQSHPYLLAGDELVENDLYLPPPGDEPDDNGDARFAAVYTGLLNRRQARRELERAERHYRVLVEKAPDPLVLLDPAGRVVYASPSAMQQYRVSDPAVVPGLDIGTLIHPDWQEKGLAFYHAMLKGIELPVSRLRLLRFDGSAFDADFNFAPLSGSNGDLEGLVAVVRDVSSQAAIEEELRQTVARLEAAQEALRMAQAYNQALLDASQDYAALLDRSGMTLAMNRAAARAINRPIESVIGQPLGDYLPPDSAQTLYNHLESVFNTCRPLQITMEIAGIYLRVRIDPLFDAAGRPVRAALMVQDITANHLAQQAQTRHAEINAILRSVSESLTRTIHQDAVLDVVLDGLRRLAPETAAHILLLAGDTAVLARWYQPDSAVSPDNLHALPPLPVKEVAGLRPMAETLQPILIADTAADPDWARVGPAAWTRSYAGAPIVSGGQLVGFITLASHLPGALSPEQVEPLRMLAGQAAVALQTSQAFQALEEKNRELTAAYRQVGDRNQALSAAYDATITGWARALELRDKATEGHSQRVVDLTMQLARRMGVRAEEHSFLRWGALLHDIGKLAIPDSILLKETALNEAEWKLMKLHPTLAYEMLSGITYLQRSLAIPYYHHEWWDGSGYPMGLKEEAIPLSARIFAVVDAWDALTSTRPYRAAWSPWRAAGHIRAMAGRQFDPAVVAAFLELIGFE